MSGVISRDVPNTLYEGELEKRGQLIRNWRPRYFVLWRDGPRLQYLARSPTNVWVPKGQINLQSVMSCTSATGQCVFKITTTDGVIHLRAKSQTICDIWIRAISACVAHKDNLGTVESMPAFDGGLAFRNRRKSVSNALVMVKPVESSPAAATLSSAASPAPSRDVVTEKSHGTLTLTIKSATDLLSKDRSGSADPYCRVYYDGYEVTTHACLNTLNPVWDKVFTLPFNRSIVQLTVDVFDYEESSKERFLGRAVVPLASVTDDKQTLMYELCKRSFKSHVRGVLCLELSTDVVEDRVLSSLFTLARSIPSLIVMRETSGPTSSVLYPPASAEAVIDASSVRMFPYFPSTPAAESQFIDGTLIFTNYRFMFVVAGHLSPVVPSLSPTPVHTTSMEDMSALMGPASFSPSVGLVSDDEEEGDEEDTIGISVAGQESVDIEPAAPSAPAPVATPAPDCEEFTVETEFVDGTSAQDTIPLPAFQVPLANVIGTMRYERTLGVASCGSLETIASSSMFEFAKGQPVLQLDCEGFKSPAFVFLPSEDGSADATATSNKVVQCSRWYEVISNSIFNRHLEPKKAWVKAVGAGDDAAVPAAPGLSSSTTLMAEYRRQGIPNHFWRISTVNQAYALSPTYPSVLVVPRIISDAVLQDAAPFRSKARIPVLTWLHPLNGACLARCSQPMVGLIGHRNSHDEQIIEALRTSMPLPSQLILIADVRPKINAVTNQAQGKGYETVGPGTNYPTACLHFMNVPNIHVMRKSLETIRKAAVDVPEQSVVSTDYEATSVLDDDIPKSKSGMSASDAASATWSKITGMFSAPAWSGAPSSSTAHVPTSSSTGPPPAPSAGAGAPTDGSDTAPSSHLTSLGFGNIGNDSGWMATVADSGWLNHCALLLGAASRVSTVLNRDAVPVVVHCSDGWDRTAQVCALSQILLDPYFRTLAGFWVLVEKEWVSFGHKFRDRLGFDHESGYRSDERSPVFLQFLDCVRMICKQHPHSFEFNLHLLAYLAEYSSCAWFPTFTSNCESERCRDVESTGGNAPSLWDTITVNQSQFTNAGYISPPLFALTPQAVVGSPGKYRREWHNAQVLTVEYSVRKLSVWTELITGWQVHVPRLFAAVQSCTCFRFATICAYCRSRSSNRRGGKPGTALTTDTTGSASRLGYHGGLTMGLKLGPSKGDSHCFRCRHEFLSMIRPRKHCFACQRSMCKNCSVKVDSSELGRLVSLACRRWSCCANCVRSRGKHRRNTFRVQQLSLWMRPALKPKSAGFYQIPGPQITPNTPVAYWVDGTGQMWYSGSKSVSAPPSPAPIPTNENEPPMRKEKPCTSRTLSREELFQDDNFAKVLAAVESNPSATVCPAPSPVLGEHSATDDAMYSNALVLLPPPTTLPNPTTTLPRGTTTWVSFLVLFLAIIICTEYCVQFFQLEHAIRPKSASGGVSEAAVPSLPPVPWMRIVYTTVDDNAKSYTAIVDTSRLALSKTSPVVCGTIRGRASGTYATSCVAPSSTYPPSEQAEFVVVGLQTDDYMFTAVSWDENGKKVVLTSSFKCTHSSPMSAISITATTI